GGGGVGGGGGAGGGGGGGWDWCGGRAGGGGGDRWGAGRAPRGGFTRWPPAGRARGPSRRRTRERTGRSPVGVPRGAGADHGVSIRERPWRDARCDREAPFPQPAPVHVHPWCERTCYTRFPKLRHHQAGLGAGRVDARRASSVQPTKSPMRSRVTSGVGCPASAAASWA